MVYPFNPDLLSDYTKPETRKIASDNSKEIIHKDKNSSKRKLHCCENQVLNSTANNTKVTNASNKTLVVNKDNSKSNNMFKKVKQFQVSNLASYR